MELYQTLILVTSVDKYCNDLFVTILQCFSKPIFGYNPSEFFAYLQDFYSRTEFGFES
jgi:hypothetical protein